MAYADQVAGSRRLATMAGVAVIHLAIGYALVSGMAVTFVRNVGHTLITTNIPIPDAPPPDPTPQPPMPKAATLPTMPSIAVPDPIVPAPAATASVHVDSAPAITFVPLPPATIDLAPPPPALPSGKASGPRARGAKSGWITTDDYPAAAIRAEQQGVVGISVQVGTNGRVDACTVTATSGTAILDEAACRLYARRARFEPARDDAGNAVSARYDDRVRWELPRQ